MTGELVLTVQKSEWVGERNYATQVRELKHSEKGHIYSERDKKNMLTLARWTVVTCETNIFF